MIDLDDGRSPWRRRRQVSSRALLASVATAAMLLLSCGGGGAGSGTSGGEGEVPGTRPERRSLLLSEGVVTVRDASDLRVLSEMRTHGIGPHELLLLGDGRTLVVANGGLVTDLSDGTRRRDLNIPDMDPSLVYLDSHDGRLLAQVRPDDHFASIRHLAVGANDAIAVAMQYEGPETNPYPVVGFHRGDERIQTIAAPRETLVRMRRYSASVCIAPSGVAAVTCPRGDLVTFFDVASGALLGTIDIRDAGGVTTTAGGREFLITTGLGEIHHIDARTLEPLRDPQRVDSHWDNHALATLAL